MPPDTKNRSRGPAFLFDGAEPGFLEPSATPRLSPSVQAQIGQRLRSYYDTLKLGEEPVPERFLEIVNRLDQARPRENKS
jgi:hypothetical protein